jgi:hypothetical protein
MHMGYFMKMGLTFTTATLGVIYVELHWLNYQGKHGILIVVPTGSNRTKEMGKIISCSSYFDLGPLSFLVFHLNQICFRKGNAEF